MVTDSELEKVIKFETEELKKEFLDWMEENGKQQTAGQK